MAGLSLIILLLWIPWFITVFNELLKNVEFWQQKEYRWDRVLAWFYDVDILHERKFKLYVVELILVFASASYFFFSNANFLLLSILIAFTIYVYLSIDFGKNLLERNVAKPNITIRNIIIFVISTIIICIPLGLTLAFTMRVFSQMDLDDFTTSANNNVTLDGLYTQETDGVKTYQFDTIVLLISTLLWLAFDLLLSIIVSLSVFVTYPLALIKRKGLINKAKSQISNHSNLKIVGITGSYGKTTTKNILYEILKGKFKVVKTPRNYNTNVGIAKTIIKDLKPDTEIFIAEMAAYKKGEIKESCEIVAPDIAIVTAVNEEHIAMFKNLQNTLLTKYEIVEYAKPDAVIILNGDNEFTLKMEEMTDKKKYMFSMSKQVDFYAESIEVETEKLSFDVIAKGVKEHFDVQILGEHNVLNILAACAAAIELEMSLKDIAQALKNAGNLGKLNLRTGINGTLVIDDSNNSNPDGFKAALSFMDKTADKSRRVLVTSGILELGRQKDIVYQNIKESIEEKVNVVVTSDLKLYKLLSGTNLELYHTPTFKAQVEQVKSVLRKGDVVLFEGANMSLFKEIVEGV